MRADERSQHWTQGNALEVAGPLMEDVVEDPVGSVEGGSAGNEAKPSNADGNAASLGLDELTQELDDQRVIVAQLFQLQDEQTSNPSWNPICEGRVLLSTESNECHLTINSLIDQEVVFNAVVHAEIEFKLREEDSNEFVAWKDKDNNQYTLSFTSNSQCRAFFQLLQSFLKDGVVPMDVDPESSATSPPFSLASLDVVHSVFEEKVLAAIPECTKESLGKLVQFFDPDSLANPSGKYFLASRIIQQDFIPHLIELFLACEKESDDAAMEQIFVVVRGLCKLENAQIFETFLHPQNIVTFARIMEHCPKYSKTPSISKPSFVQYLHAENKLQELAAVKGKNIISDDISRLIEHIFRLQYFREYVFPQVMEEDPIMNISLLIRMCYKELFTMIVKNPAIFQLVNCLSQQDSTEESADYSLKLAVFQFLKEFFISLKANFVLTSQVIAKGINYEIVISSINHSLEHVNETDPELIGLQLDVLSNICEQDGQLVIDHAKLHCEEENDLLRNLVLALHQASDEYVRFNITQCLKFTLYAIPESDAEFVNLFFTKYAPILIAPVISRYSETNVEFSTESCDAIYCVLDILELCFSFHYSSLRGFLSRNSFLDSLVWLLTVAEDKRLLLAILRFLRSLLAFPYEYFSTFFTKKTFFKSLVFLLEKHDNSNDMLVSCVFSILDLIKDKPPLRTVLVGLIENYGDCFREVFFSYNPLIQELLLAYDKLFENPPIQDLEKQALERSTSATSTLIHDELVEENYFANDEESISTHVNSSNNNADEPEAPPLSPRPKASEEDEDDFSTTPVVVPSKPKQMKIIIDEGAK